MPTSTLPTIPFKTPKSFETWLEKQHDPRIGHFNIKSLKLAFFASFNDLNVINKLVSLNC